MLKQFPARVRTVRSPVEAAALGQASVTQSTRRGTFLMGARRLGGEQPRDGSLELHVTEAALCQGHCFMAPCESAKLPLADFVPGNNGRVLGVF